MRRVRKVDMDGVPGQRLGRTARRRRLAVAVVVTCSSLLSAGCVQLPEQGPVVETRSEGNLNDDVGIYIDPKPPRSGDSAPDIVKGFLDAMTATPIQTNVARQFLTKDAAASWDPELQTITYADASPPRGGSRVSVTLTGAEVLDARGAWLGQVPGVDDVLAFPMTLENDEVRIAEAPNALIVPQSWFEQRFRQVSLYFFDPTAQVLVPEPVFVPRGEQLATTLIKALLRGPGPGLGRVSRSFIPPGLTIGLSVPVSPGGVADIALKGEAGQQTPQAIELMLAQFAWALRQEPTIRAFRLSIGGVQLQLPAGQGEVSVNQGQEFDPTGAESSGLLFGVSEGRLVSGSATDLTRVDGPFGATTYGIDTIGVNLDATRVAAVSGRGTAVLVGPLRGPDTDVRQIIDGATRLLRPAWDFANRLWLVDRAGGRARVSYVAGSQARSLKVPRVSGRSVSRFLISRDGSRLVVVVRRNGYDRIMVSRIQHDGQGRVLRATRARRIAWEGGERLDIRDIGWRGPTTVAVLHVLTDELSQVRTISVDGSPPGLDSLSTTLRGRALALAGSPDPSDSLYAVTRSSLIDLSSFDRGNASVEPRASRFTYVG